MRKVRRHIFLFFLFVAFRAYAQDMDMDKLNRKGDLLFGEQKYEQAIAVWEKVLQKNPKDVNTMIRIGIALSYLEKYDQAYTILSRARRIELENPKVFYHLGLLFLKQNQDDLALQYFHEVTEITDFYPGVYFHLGLIYERKGLKEKALECYVMEVNNNPASWKTWERISALKKGAEISDADAKSELKKGVARLESWLRLVLIRYYLVILSIILAIVGGLYLWRRKIEEGL